MTPIQKLEQKKKLIHRKNFQKKYPNGCFSLQIRYGQYGFSSRPDPIRRVELRWGTKTDSTQYFHKSFRIQANREVSTINNSFDYVYNFSSFGELMQKCKRENVPEELIIQYTQECQSRDIIINS